MVTIGCAPLRAILSPESVVADAAGQTVNRAADGLQSASAQQTDSDLDRIINEHGEAGNADELKRLQQDLKDNPLAIPQQQSQPLLSEPPPQEFDRRYRPPNMAYTPYLLAIDGYKMAEKPYIFKPNVLLPDHYSGSTHRGIGEPFAAATQHNLPISTQRVFDLDYRQFRYESPDDTPARRPE